MTEAPPPPPDEDRPPQPPAGSPPPPPSAPIGGYPPPPPPPPPGYGQPVGGYPPPPAPPTGYGQPAYGAPGPGQYSAPGGEPGFGDALSYGWAKFKQNVGTILPALLIYFFGAIVVLGILFVLVILPLRGDGSGLTSQLVNGAVQTVVFGLVSYVVQAGLIRGVLAITRGEKPALNVFLTPRNLGQVLLAAVIISVASGIGSLLCFLPGIVVSFVTQFALFFIVDKDLSAVDGIKASVDFTMKNLATLLVFSIIAFLIVVVAAVLCLLPLLVAFPVVLIAQAYLYKRLQGEPVA